MLPVVGVPDAAAAAPDFIFLVTGGAGDGERFTIESLLLLPLLLLLLLLDEELPDF